ncbi:MAG: hypothetical protein ABR956_17630 [Terracidiphilus sp.]
MTTPAKRPAQLPPQVLDPLALLSAGCPTQARLAQQRLQGLAPRVSTGPASAAESQALLPAGLAPQAEEPVARVAVAVPHRALTPAQDSDSERALPPEVVQVSSAEPHPERVSAPGLTREPAASASASALPRSNSTPTLRKVQPRRPSPQPSSANSA